MAVTSWTSEGMNFSSLAALKAQPLQKKHVEALRLAITERLTAINISRDDTFNEPLVDFEPSRKSNSPYFFESKGEAIDRAVEAIYGNFVNYTLPYVGERFITNWSQATILTEIGDAEWLTVGDDYPITAEWLFQKYKAINLLTWTTMRSRPSELSRISQDIRQGPSVNWATLPWVNDVLPGIIVTGTKFTQAIGPDLAVRRRTTFRIGSIPAGFDWYGDLILSAGMGSATVPATFADQGTGWVDDKWNLIETYTQNSDSSKVFTVGDIDAVPTGSPPSGERLGFNMRFGDTDNGNDAEYLQDSNAKGPFLIRKYDGPSGFAFI